MDLAQMIGDPRKVDRELAQFRRTTKLLSADRPRLIDKYHKKWVALCDSEVKVVADTLEGLLADVEQRGVSRQGLVVRYIDRELRTMIL